MLLGLILLLMVVLLFFEEWVREDGESFKCYLMRVSLFSSLVRKVNCTTWLAKLEEMITFTLKEVLMTALLKPRRLSAGVIVRRYCVARSLSRGL
jgi:type II secretory pathway component PulF